MSLAAVIYDHKTDYEVSNRYEISRDTDYKGRVFYRAYRCYGVLGVHYLCERQESFGGAMYYLLKALREDEFVDIEPAEAEWAE